MSETFADKNCYKAEFSIREGMQLILTPLKVEKR